MVVQVLYTVHGIWNVLHYDAIQKVLELYGSYHGIWWNIAEHRPELDGTEGKLLKTTSYRTEPRLGWPLLLPIVTSVDPITIRQLLY